MKKTLRTLLAFTLAGSMLLPLSACGKSKTGKNTDKDKKKVVSSEDSDPEADESDETDEEKKAQEDPAKSETQADDSSGKTQDENVFYTSKSAELKLKPIPGVEFDYTIFSNTSIAGDRILVRILATLKDPSMGEKLLKNDYQDMGDNLYTSLQLFDLNGKNIGSVPMDENCDFENAFALDNGEILVVTSKFNDGECRTSPSVFVISPSGEKLRELNFDVEANLYGSHVYPMKDGKIFVATEEHLFLFDSEGNLIKENQEQSLGPFMNYSEGKWYVARIAIPHTDIAAYQEVDVNTGELLDTYKSELSNSIDFANNTDCFVFTEDGIQQFLISQDTFATILSPENTDLEFTDLRNCQILPDGSMIVLNSEPNTDVMTDKTDYLRNEANRMSVAILTRVEES